MNFPSRRKVWHSPSHAVLSCAATVTAVAAVAAAGTSAYGAYSQSKSAKDAQAGLAGDKAGAYGSKVKDVKYEDHVNLPEYDELAGARDYEKALPMLGNVARQQTIRSQRLRDWLTGGQSTANLQQEGADINGLLKGDVPMDVQDQINRMVASRTGGAFSPAGQKNQMAQADYARKIGMTSTQMMQLGMSAAPQWEQLTDSFTYKPQQAFSDALAALRERDSYTTGSAAVQLKRDEQQYEGDVNSARIQAMPNPQIAGYTNDALQLSSLDAKQQQNMINALLGTVKSGAALYNTVVPPKTTPTTPATGEVSTNALKSIYS